MTDSHQSKFLESAYNSKKQMDAVSPTLCLAKWKQVSLHLATGMTNSCYHPPLHAIDATLLADNPSALHNTPYKKEQRKIMLRGERPSECQYCWTMEDLGQLSDRHYRSGEPWAAMDLDALKNSTGEEDVIPSYVEVNFNNVCNLACSYCSPQYSSAWAQEIERYGGYPTHIIHNDPSHFTGGRRVIPNREHNPYVEAFWQWWPNLYPKLRHFRMTGGEPLLDKNTYRVFDYVLAAPHPELHLNVTSNFSVDQRVFERYLSYVQRLCSTNIEHFMQYVSVDTGDAGQAEYIRDGLEFNRLMLYVNQYLQEAPERNSLTFIITLNNLGVLGLDQILDYILELRSRYSRTYQRVWFDTPLLRQPSWMSLQVLPQAYHRRMEQHLKFMQDNVMPPNSFVGFKDYEIQRMERALAWMREPQTSERLARDRADFYRYFSEYDRRRKRDFLQTFPNMQVFYEECRTLARG